MTKYYGVIGNRDHIKFQGEKRPFWEFLDRQPDGYLSSLAYMPIPFGMPKTPKIADCGAWSYKAETVPKLGRNFVTPEWTIEQYKQYFDPGDLVVAPDHMLVDGISENELNDRRKFNLASARTFLPIARLAGFNPMATVHGMTLEERLINVDRLYEIGYRHFSLGGLAARASQKKTVLTSIQAISDKIRAVLPNAWIHVLGLSSPDYFSEFTRMNIDSCDGSSHFKQAFTAGALFVIEGGKLTKYQAARCDRQTGKVIDAITAPECYCLACSRMSEEKIDTRTYGSNENNMGRAAHNLNILMQAQAISIQQQRSIALVSCVGEKASEILPAKDLYRSQWFIKARRHVEQSGDNWYVISAEYGLLHRDATIPPYEKTLNTMPAVERRAWSDRVFRQIQETLPNGGTIRIFAGERYREYLIPLLENSGYSVEVPLQGLGIGLQLQWFDNEFQPKQLALPLR